MKVKQQKQTSLETIDEIHYIELQKLTPKHIYPINHLDAPLET